MKTYATGSVIVVRKVVELSSRYYGLSVGCSASSLMKLESCERIE
ncbi:MAG: hypothetical protein QXT76_01590 [Sulfolobales archaeon]